jgi:hypothetical protein
MGVANYKAKQSKHNSRAVWIPVLKKGMAFLKSGAVYEVLDDGWRRRRDLELAKA